MFFGCFSGPGVYINRYQRMKGSQKGTRTAELRRVKNKTKGRDNLKLRLNRQITSIAFSLD